MANITGDANANLIFGDQSDQLAPTPQNFIDSQNSADLIQGDGGNDTISGLGGNDRIFGNQGNDLLYGDIGDDQIFAGQGSDTVIGGAGNDSIQGNKETDLLFGLDGDDTIEGNLGDDFIFGGAGKDSLTGNKASDQIFGGEGDDTLDGGVLDDDPTIANDDILTGDAGADVFVLRPDNITNGNGSLAITDFEDGIDKFQIINESSSVAPTDIQTNVVGADTQLQFVDDEGDLRTIAVLQDLTGITIDANDFVV